jgi:hypothetical protein
MGQGLYRAVGFGCLNPPDFEGDNRPTPGLHDAVEYGYEAEPDYAMIPFGVDDEALQAWWGLPPLPKGLPHIEEYTAQIVERCRCWPDVGTHGIWVPHRIESTWELLREVAKVNGVDLPEGQPIFVCDWD